MGSLCRRNEDMCRREQGIAKLQESEKENTGKEF
jgi:hypothetical protein